MKRKDVNAWIIVPDVLKRGMALFVMTLLLIAVGSPLSQSGPDEDLKNQYLNLPVDLQAQCALAKLNRAIEEAGGGGDQGKLQLLRQGRQWLATAIAKYNEYIGGPTQTTRPVDPAASPMGMLTHLWLAKEGMIQHRASSQRSAAPSNLSPERINALEKAINEAIDAIGKAVEEVESARGWTVHNDGMFLSIHVPPGFRAAKNPSYRLYLTWLPPGGRDVEKALFVSVAPNKDEAQPYEHQRRAITREREEHSDLVVIENSRGYGGVSGLWFTYGYTWQSKELTGLIHHYTDAYNVWEIKYLTVASKFDDEECEGIIRSVQRK